MNWEAIGAVGEIVGALAVFLTLIYLAMQIRQNTLSVRAAAVDASISHVSNIRESIFASADITDIYVEGGKDPFSLEEKPLVRYRLLIHNILLAISNIHEQSKLTGLSQSSWESQEPIIERIVSTPGGAWFWENYRHEFEESFRQEVDDILRKSRAAT
jgi:hypothetical protein